MDNKDRSHQNSTSSRRNKGPSSVTLFPSKSKSTTESSKSKKRGSNATFRKPHGKEEKPRRQGRASKFPGSKSNRDCVDRLDLSSLRYFEEDIDDIMAAKRAQPVADTSRLPVPLRSKSTLMISDRQYDAKPESSPFFESRDSLQTSPERSVCLSSREPVVIEMRETSPLEEAIDSPAAVRMVEEDKTSTQILEKSDQKTCKKTRTTGRGKMQFAFPRIGIFRGKKSAAKKAKAETQPKGSSSSKTTAKKEMKKDPSPPKALSPSTLPKLEGASSLKTTGKKEMKKKLPSPMPSTVARDMSEPSLNTFGLIDSSFPQVQLGRERGMPPPEDTSSVMGLNLDGKKEFEPFPVKTEDHETAAATCPGEANTPVVTGGQVKTAQDAQPDKMNQPAISSEPAKVNNPAEVVDPQEDSRSEPAGMNQPAGSTAQPKVDDSAEVVDPKDENKPEAGGGAYDWLSIPSFAAAGMALALSSLPRQEKAMLSSSPRQEKAMLSSSPRKEKVTFADEKMSLRTQANSHRDPAIDLERKLNAIKDIRASIAGNKKKSTYAPCGSSYFDEPETIDAMNGTGDTRNDDKTAKSSFSKRKAASPLSPSIHDIGSTLPTLEKSLFRESTVAKSTLRGFDSLAWSSSEEGSASVGSLSAMTQVSSLAGTDGVSVRSSRSTRSSRSSRSRGTGKSTPKDKKADKQSMKEAEESIKRAEEALAVFKQHAQRLRNEEQDRLLQGSRSRGTGKSTPKDEISDEHSLKEVEQSTEHVEEALAFFKQHAQRLGC